MIGKEAFWITDVNCEYIFFPNCSTLTVEDHFTIDFICIYDMVLYPFDVQLCKASITLAKVQKVELVPMGEPMYDGPKDLMKYWLRGIHFKVTQAST